MRKHRFLNRKKPKNEDLALQITAMADIFTVILVFLLKSFSTGITGISPGTDLLLPEASAQDQVVDTLKVEISSDSVLLEDKLASKLRKFRFLPDSLESDGTPRDLNSAFIAAKKQEKSRNPAASKDAAVLTQLLVLADRNTPYSTLRTILLAAGKFGYEEYKLVVITE